MADKVETLPNHGWWSQPRAEFRPQPSRAARAPEPDTPTAMQTAATDESPAAAELRLIAIAQRDPAQFGPLYREHHPAIAGYIYRRVGDSHAADDLVADVFTTALQYLRRYRPQGLPLRAWLYRLASNRVNRWARRERGRAFAQLSCSNVDPASNARQISEDRRATVRAALLTLPTKYQTVIALHYLECLPVSDVATALGCSEGTVKSRLSRGRDHLRRRLESRRYEL
ncbi:MAG: RNA polymerase sigma factor [Phycisphaerae bacterium]|nr:RNA polymerase sigma factor [Phycisphaerae bacterium]